jgi:hypothetical protein
MILKKFEKGGKTVSQIWEEKTGTAWAEARKQGVSDGTYASNMALRKSLLDGTFSKDKKVAPKELNLKKEMSIVDKDYDGPTEFPKKEESTQKSFSQAFLKARQESLDTFQWNGKSYTTKIKGEDTPKEDAKVNTTEEVKPAEGLTEGAEEPKQPTAPKAPAPYAGYNYPSFGTKQPTTATAGYNWPSLSEVASKKLVPFNNTTTPKKAPYITVDQNAIRSAYKAALRFITPFNPTTKI